MPGIRLLSHFQMGRETTLGTGVAATRMFYPDLSSTFSVDWMKTYHEGRRTLRRNPVTYATRQGEMVNINFRTVDDAGISFDELPFFLQWPNGATAATSGGTSYLWDTFAWGGTANGTVRGYTCEYGDDTQNYEAEYVVGTRLGLSADTDGMTQLTASMVGRQSTKSAKTALTPTDPVYIPGYLWSPRFATSQSGLSGASDIANFMRSWSLDWGTGIAVHNYQDGNDYFGQAVESAAVEGTLSMTVDSTSDAVSRFYDKGEAGTIDFVQLSATGADVGDGTAYNVTIQAAVEYTNVQMLDGDNDGVNTYSVNAKLVDDETWGQTLGISVVNNLASLAV